MNSAVSFLSSSPAHKPLRIWPALALAAIVVLCRFVPTFIEGASSQYWFVPIFFPMIGSALILIWWLAASRATGREKGLGLLGVIAAMAVVVWLGHPSMRGMLVTYFTLPLGMVGFAVAAWACRNHAPPRRLRGILMGTALALSVALFLRSAGVTGDYAFDLLPRWRPEADASQWAAAAPVASKPAPAEIEAAIATAEWPGFRGADRMGHADGPKIDGDWVAHPPRLRWKKPVGAAWSSFAVAGAFAFTQEQRGPRETAVCYDLNTGQEVWAQSWEARFDEPMGGPGPRATPTLADGAVFVFGGSGLLARLQGGTGEVVWKQDVRALSGRELPMWGFSSSPLVTHSLVIVHAGGADDRGVMAFDAANGELRWSVACGPESYSSPQLSRILGEETLLMLTNHGLLLLDPATGKVRLDYTWKFNGYRALQPTVIGDDTILLPTPMSEGTRAIRLSQKDGQIAAEELWTTKHMKPDFTELTVHNGHLYGIDGSRFSCINLENGQRVWKQGSYGKGQALLLTASDLLLIAAEDGRVVLVKADPAVPVEVASIQAISGKTWNHPVVVGNLLLVRNAEEMACYELPLAK
jgi:outer membrane protein assembly factor BamB